MRRVLTIIAAIVLLVVSLGIGLFTADLPFWRRAMQLPLPADGIYLPVATLGGDAGAEAIPVAAPVAADGVEPLVLEEQMDVEPVHSAHPGLPPGQAPVPGRAASRRADPSQHD